MPATLHGALCDTSVSGLCGCETEVLCTLVPEGNRFPQQNEAHSTLNADLVADLAPSCPPGISDRLVYGKLLLLFFCQYPFSVAARTPKQ